METIVYPLFFEETYLVIGWTLIHSLWQGLVLVLILFRLLKWFEKKDARWRYRVSLAVLFLLFGGVISTFFYLKNQFNLSKEGLIVIPSFGIGHQTIVSDAFPLENQENIQPAILLKSATNMINPYMPYLAYGWFLGFLIFVIQLLLGYRRLRFLKKSAISLPATIQDTIKKIQGAFNIKKRISILESAHIDSPILIGWLKPMILLPLSLHTHISAKELEAILAHELAHIRRMDYPIRILQSVIQCLLYYHPAMWWMSKQIDREREHCCDDLAIQYTKDPLSFAKAIMLIEEYNRRTVGNLALGFRQKEFTTLGRIQRLFGRHSTIIINLKEKIMMTLCAFLFGSLTFFSPMDSLSFEKEKIYGTEKCKIVKGTKTKNNKRIYSTYNEYILDEQGRETRWNYYYADGSLYYANESVYDEQGRRTKYLHYNSDNEYDGYYLFEYNENGFEEGVKHFTKAGDLDEIWTYTTNEQGQVIREDHKRADGSLKSYWIRTYDSYGNNIQKDIYLSSGKLYSYMKSTYDKNGKEQSFGEYYADGSEKFLYKWEYDCSFGG